MYGFERIKRKASSQIFLCVRKCSPIVSYSVRKRLDPFVFVWEKQQQLTVGFLVVFSGHTNGAFVAARETAKYSYDDI